MNLFKLFQKETWRKWSRKHKPMDFGDGPDCPEVPKARTFPRGGGYNKSVIEQARHDRAKRKQRREEMDAYARSRNYPWWCRNNIPAK